MLNPPREALPKPVCTLTLFGLKAGNTRWGLAQMGTLPPKLKAVPGLRFCKMLGCGRGAAFSLLPDLRRYGLFCCWEDEAYARTFFAENLPFQQYQARTSENWTVWLQPLQAHGLWDGLNPFEISGKQENHTGPVAVLTRATVRISALPSFWKYAPATTRALNEASGLLASIGLGELPFVRQATFSLWQNADDLKAYAYGNAQHKEVIRKTREGKWYAEELFARFIPLRSEGLWHGTDPLHFPLPEKHPENGII